MHNAEKYCFYIVCWFQNYFENSFKKTSGLLFIFVCSSMGHAHFLNNKIYALNDLPHMGWCVWTRMDKEKRSKHTLHTPFVKQFQ